MTGAPGSAPRVHMAISPRGWGLDPASEGPSNSAIGKALAKLGLDKDDVETRAKNNTFHWLKRQFNNEAGAFHGFYNAQDQSFADFQTVNLIAPFQCLAAFDRFGDEQFLDMAKRCAHWLESNMVESHPMSLVLGGVLDNIKPTQLWTKYTADYVTLNLGLWEQTGQERYLEVARQGCRFLFQSQNHGFAPKYDHWHEQWIGRGWQSFGRVIMAMTALEEFTTVHKWLDRAVAWADFGLSLQADNGCFYLINDTYYSSDIAADEIRGLLRIHLRTGDRQYLEAATRFADWHLQRQDERGTWPLCDDRGGEPVTVYTGPGDMPNIAMALLFTHRVTGEDKYLASAVKALRYCLTQQQMPEGDHQPYHEDPNTHWGFWSWDPPYDYTMSADQSTHHVRGFWFFLDYAVTLTAKTLNRVAKLLAEWESD